MKTVTVTTQNVINYGAVLQSYALQQTLFSLGVDDALLDLKRTYSPYYRKVSFSNVLSSAYNNAVLFVRKSKMQRKEERFCNFVKENLKTTKEYQTISEVISEPPLADAYITGGDQMFNQSIMKRATNVLNFGPESTVRVSYSTSMGTEWFKTENEKKFFEDSLNRYSSLSLREQSHAKTVSEMLGREVPFHIDPSLLLNKDEWSELVKNKSAKKDYILCYSLLNNPLLNDLVKSEKKRTGLPVWVISPDSRCYVKNADRIIYDAGPYEFLELIFNAKEVISTSFHGVCFSLVFEKPFYALTRSCGDSRFESLLDLLGLSDRIVKSLEELPIKDVDYVIVKKIIENEKQRSIEYLRGALCVK